MNSISKAERLRKFLPDFQPEFEPEARGLAVYSAAISLADEKTLAETATKTESLGAGIDSIYEIMLQSYLFLGFPRMLTAAESFRASFPNYKVEVEPAEYLKERGIALCRKVYAENYDRLKEKVISFTPEIFDWMILEGYGKVLSRPRLDIKIRELAIVSCLMIEKRPKQLRSHIRGALNVGVEEKLLNAVINDIGRIDEQGSGNAKTILEQIKANV